MPRPGRRDDNESMVKGVAIDDNTNGNKSQAVESSDGTCI
jgi:hypothetical protein